MITIQINGFTYTQLSTNDLGKTTIKIQPSGQDAYFEEVPFLDYKGLARFVAAAEGIDIMTLPLSIAQDYNAETLNCLPFMELQGKLVRFTNVVLCEGFETIYLVIDKEFNYHFLSSVYEPDCDGAYISNHYIETLTKDYSEYKVILRDYPSDKELMEAIYTLNS